MGDPFDEEYEEPFDHDYTRFREVFTSEAASRLVAEGYVVIDNFFGRAWAKGLLQEMKWLQRKELLSPNKTQFTSPDGAVHTFSKPHIFEADLHDESVRSRIPLFDELFWSPELVGAISEKLPTLFLVGGYKGVTIKLQRNEGGGAFPLHHDNPGQPNKRRLSCLLYLNEHWSPGDGGELVMQPFLRPAVTIPPLMDRMVFFLSDVMLHSVSKAVAPRYCFTIWIDGANVNNDRDKQIRLSAEQLLDLPGTAAMLALSPQQRLLTRAVYAEAYESSLLECMTGAEGCEEMLAAHRQHVENVRRNAGMHGFVTALRQLLHAALEPTADARKET